MDFKNIVLVDYSQAPDSWRFISCGAFVDPLFDKQQFNVLKNGNLLFVTICPWYNIEMNGEESRHRLTFLASLLTWTTLRRVLTNGDTYSSWPHLIRLSPRFQSFQWLVHANCFGDEIRNWNVVTSSNKIFQFGIICYY